MPTPLFSVSEKRSKLLFVKSSYLITAKLFQTCLPWIPLTAVKSLCIKFKCEWYLQADKIGSSTITVEIKMILFENFMNVSTLFESNYGFQTTFSVRGKFCLGQVCVFLQAANFRSGPNFRLHNLDFFILKALFWLRNQKFQA